MERLEKQKGERAWDAAARAAGCASNDYAKLRDTPDVWCEITEEAYWEALEVLPPIYFPGGFAVSEPVCEGKHGTVYLLITTSAGRHFARYGSRPQVA